MSKGKSEARDKRYGRRGGRWADEYAGSDRTAEVHRIRLASIEKGADDDGQPHWPQESIEIWRGLADSARRKLDENEALTEIDQRALEVDDLARKVGR